MSLSKAGFINLCSMFIYLQLWDNLETGKKEFRKIIYETWDSTVERYEYLNYGINNMNIKRILIRHWRDRNHHTCSLVRNMEYKKTSQITPSFPAEERMMSFRKWEEGKIWRENNEFSFRQAQFWSETYMISTRHLNRQVSTQKIYLG